MPVGNLSLPLGSVLTGQPEVIKSSVLAAAAASVSFQFPSVYRAVLVEGWTKDTVSAFFYIRVNNDTGANYTVQQIEVGSTSVTGSRLTGQTKWSGPGVTGIAGQLQFSLFIAKTTAAAKAQMTMIASIGLAASIGMDITGGEWGNTADLLSRVDIFPSGGNFDVNTSITLWGFRL